MAWDDLDNNGISDIVEDKLLQMEMGRGETKREESPKVSSSTHSTSSGGTGNSVFVWTDGLLKYASRRTKMALTIAGILTGVVTVMGMVVAFVIY